jgi:hypothetical protein
VARSAWQFGKEPKTSSWIQAVPENVEKDKEFVRGSVVNFVHEAEFLVENGTYIDTTKDFRFYTGITLVDMRGGEKFKTGDLTSPSRVLVMDPAGGLSVREELEDATAVKAYRDTFTKKRATSERDNPLESRRRGR